MEEYWVGAYKLSANKLVSYPVNILARQRTAEQVENQRNLSRGDYNGYMSNKTKAKVSTMLNNWYASIHIAQKRAKKTKEKILPYLTFVTLTLSAKQEHSDNEIKRKCLNLFITKLKESKGVNHFFWRAETQGNGNIHFHVICDRYIDKNWLQKHWNLSQNVLGYVDRFESVFGHKQPPSTHVVKVSSLREASQYVVNYMKKHEGRRIVNGRIWGCSVGLEKIQSLCAIHSADFAQFEAYLSKNPYVYKKLDNAFSVYVADMFVMLSKKFKQLYTELERHYKLQYDKLYLKEDPPEVKPILNVIYCPF